MPDIEEAVRDALGAHARGGPSSETLWTDVQHRIRRRKRRRQSLMGAAAAFVLVAAGLGIALATRGDGDESTVVDVGPGPSTSLPAAATTTMPNAANGEEPSAESVAIPLDPLAAAEGAVRVWTGSTLIAWGGISTSVYPVGRPEGVRYDTADRTWRAIADAPLDPRADAAGVWTGTELLVWGGYSAREPAGTQYRTDGAAYDPATDTWRPIAASPLPPDAYRGIWTGTELVVIGGGEATVAGAAYDPATNTWRTIAPPPRALVRWTSVMHGGTVLIVGAERTGEAAAVQFRVLGYDAATDGWTDLGGQSTEEYDIGAAVVGDMLVVWGHNHAPIWRLDLATGAWTTGADSPVECVGLGPAAATDGDGVVTDICGVPVRYDVTTDAWSELDWPADQWIIVGDLPFRR